MDFQEKLYDTLQRMRAKIHTGIVSTVQGIREKTQTALEGPKTIEIAGKKILAMPLESMSLTPEQQKKFTQTIEEGGIGGFEVNTSTMSESEQIQFAKDHQKAPIDWQVSFEDFQEEIDETPYKGFDLFKKVYEAFPDIQSMTKEEAIEAGIYPTIHYRNFAARKWMAEMNGGHLATLDKDYNGELRDIYDAAPGKTNLEKLAAMGQALLGGRDPYNEDVYNFGSWTELGSGSLNRNGVVRTFDILRGRVKARNGRCPEIFSISSVVVLDK